MSETPPNTLQYRVDGPEDAPVLVLGPALGTTWHMWDRQIPELSRNRRVLRFDLPGHGGSPAEPAHTVGELTDRLVATLDALGVERFDYAGCAFASALGTDLALRHPHRLNGLALLGSAARFGTADGEGVRRNGLEPIARAVPERWFAPAFASAQPAIVDWAVQMVRSTDLNCFAAACEALAAFDVQADLSRVAAPTLVVVGADDQVTPPAQARALVAGIPDARLAVVPGACHLTPVEQPAAVTDLLLRHFTTPAAAVTAVRVPGAPVRPAGRVDDWPVPSGSTPAAPVPGPGRPGDAAAGTGAGQDGWPVPSGGTPATPVPPGPARPGDGAPGSAQTSVDDWPAAPGPRPGAAPKDTALPPRPAGTPDDWPVAAGSTPSGTAVPARAAGTTSDWPAPKDGSAAGDWPAQAPAMSRPQGPGTGPAAPAGDWPVPPATAPPQPMTIDDWPAPAVPGAAGDWPAPAAGSAAPGPGAPPARPMTVDDWPVPAGSTPAADSGAPAARPAGTAGDGSAPEDGSPAAVPARPSGAADDWPLLPGKDNAPSGTESLSAGFAAAVAPSGADALSARPAGAVDGRPVPPGGVPYAAPDALATRPAAAVERRPVPAAGTPSAVDAAPVPAAGLPVPFPPPAGLPVEDGFDDFHELVAARDATIWARPGLDLRSRLLVTLAALTAGGHLDELERHLRAALRHGVAAEEVKEVLLQCAVSCSPPAVRAAYAVARRVVAEEGEQEEVAEPQP